MSATGNVKDEVDRGSRVRVSIDSAADIVMARHAGRMLAERAGFSPGEHTLVATAIHELARNILEYASRGEIRLSIVEEEEGTVGLKVEASDNGPGMDEPERAARGGYSTSGGLGFGLAGVRHIMDDFHLHSAPGLGTRVTATKWRH